MWKILKYSFIDLFRSKWILSYLFFFFIVSEGLIYFNGNLSKSVASLMNIILFLCSLIGIMFGTIYYYNSKEFIQLILAQPLKRSSIFIGHYLGMNLSLVSAFVIGTGLPFLLNGVIFSDFADSFVLLLLIGVFLTSIFSAISYYISLKSENRIAGFGLSIFIWLFFAVIYDGLLMVALLYFEDYPLDKFSLIAIMFNPIDISRILILLKLDISAMMGYSGAVFSKFFGTYLGMSISMLMLMLWSLVPIIFINKSAKSKDF